MPGGDFTFYLDLTYKHFNILFLPLFIYMLDGFAYNRLMLPVACECDLATSC